MSRIVRGAMSAASTRPLAVGIVLWAVAVSVLATLGPWTFRTNDDVEMMAVVTGMGGGEPRSELQFTSILIGAPLRWLYAVMPGIPWYGGYLHALQSAALVILIAAMLRGAARSIGPVALAVVVPVVLLGAGFVLSLQYTIVAILVVGAGAVGALTDLGADRLTVRRALGWGAFAGVGGLVRFQSLGLVLVVLVAASAVVLALRSGRRAVLAPVAALLVATVVTGGLGLAADLRFASGLDGGPVRLSIGTHGLPSARAPLPEVDGVPPPPTGIDRRLADPSELSPNDRLVLSRWITLDADYLQRPAPDGGAPARGGDRLAVRPFVGRLAEAAGAAVVGFRPTLGLAGRDWPVAAAALVVVALALVRRRRAALAFVAVLLAGLAVAGLVGGASRLPDRVGLPLLLVTWCLSVAAAGVVRSAGAERSRTWSSLPARWRVPSTVAGLLVVGIAGLAESRAIGEQLAGTVELLGRAEATVRDLEDLLADEPNRPTVVFWLNEVWPVVRPLEPGGHLRFPARSLDVATWGYRTRFRTEQRAALGAEDWIGAVADRDDVWMVADPEAGELLRTYLFERRGRLCTEAVLAPTTLGEGWYVYKRFVDRPCTGIAIGR